MNQERDGARLLTGGGQPQRPGYFVEPTLFADATNAMTIAREEIFGPVAAIIAFDSDDEAVAIANDCDYALAATVWTCDVSRAHTVARKIRAIPAAISVFVRVMWPSTAITNPTAMRIR